MPRCAIYARTSTDKQRERHTIDSQLRLLPEYAERKEWDVYDTYVDDGRSGETLAGRPGFQRLLDDAKANRFEILLVVDIDRIVRSSSWRETGSIYDHLREHKIKVATPESMVDLQNSDEGLLVGIRGQLSGWEKNKILERMKRGRIEALKQGRYLGSNLPFGLQWNRDTMSFEVVDEEAIIVRKIFDWAINENLGAVTIAKRLNEQGCPTRSMRQYPEKFERYERETKKGKERAKPKPPTKWSSVVVHRILTNEACYGDFVNNRFKGRNKKIVRPKSEWITVKVPPIISKETWDLARHKMQERAKFVKGNTKHEYLLSGMLRCAECGRRIGGRFAKGRKPSHATKSYYICPGRLTKNKRSCSLPYFDAAKVDRAAWELVEKILKDPAFLEKALAEAESEAPKVTQDDLKSIQKTIDRLSKEEDAVVRLFRKGKISERQLEVQLSEIEGEKASLAQERARIAAALKGEAEKARQVASSRARITEIEKRIDGFSFEDRKELLRALVIGDGPNGIELDADGKLTLKGVLDLPEPRGKAPKTKPGGQNGPLDCELRHSGSPAGSLPACRGFIRCECHSVPQPSIRGRDAEPRRY